MFINVITQNCFLKNVNLKLNAVKFPATLTNRNLIKVKLIGLQLTQD